MKTLQDIEDRILKNNKNRIIKLLKDSLNNPIKLIKPEDISNKSGHYIIMCNKPTPNEAVNHNPQLPYGELFIWYNGTANDIRSRIKTHLYRPLKQRQGSGASSGIKVSLFKGLSGHNHTKSSCGKVWELGADINEIKWKDYIFYIAENRINIMSNVIEQIFKEEIGNPPLTKCKVR